MSHRIPQVNSLIQHELSTLLLTEVEFPKNALVTITRVETSRDLRHAKAWLTVLPAYYTGKVLTLLGKSTSHLEYLLHGKLSMKPLPRLHFKIDETEKKAAEIEALLDQIKDSE